MVEILFAFLSQVGVDEAASAPLPCPEPILITASATGRFVVVAGGENVHVLSGETLNSVHEVDFESTAVGFNAKDETMTVVGTQVVRFETRGWKETFRADLPDGQFRKPPKVRGEIITDLRWIPTPEGWLAGQAMVSPDGRIYYRTKQGRLSVAREVEGKLLAESVAAEFREEGVEINRVFTVPPGPTLVQLDGVTGTVVNGRAYHLARSNSPLAVGLRGSEMALVTRHSLNVYSTTTWKRLSAHETAGENEAAVFDARRGRFILADGLGLRAWDGKMGSADGAIQGASGRFSGLAIDAAASRLYGLEAKKIRCWRLKD